MLNKYLSILSVNGGGDDTRFCCICANEIQVFRITPIYSFHKIISFSRFSIGCELCVLFFSVNVNCVIFKTSYTPVPLMAMNHFISFNSISFLSLSLFFAQLIFDDGNSCLVFQFFEKPNFDIRLDRLSSVYKKGRSMQMCDSHFILY